MLTRVAHTVPKFTADQRPMFTRVTNTVPKITADQRPMFTRMVHTVPKFAADQRPMFIVYRKPPLTYLTNIIIYLFKKASILL